MDYEVWDEITYRFPNFNGYTVEVVRIDEYNSIPHVIKHMITYPSRD